MKDIKKASKSNKMVDHEPEIPRTDAVTVKDLVEKKFMPKKRKIKPRTHLQTLFSEKYQVLIEEVFLSTITLKLSSNYLAGGHWYYRNVGL